MCCSETGTPQQGTSSRYKMQCRPKLVNGEKMCINPQYVSLDAQVDCVVPA